MANINPTMYCGRYKKHLPTYSVKCNSKSCVPKNCVTSNKGSSYRENVCRSAGMLTSNTLAKPKKTTKSDLVLCKNILPNHKMIDCCQNCGDTSNKNISKISTKHSTQNSLTSIRTSSKCTRTTKNVKKPFIKQHYKNVNFQQSTDSIGAKDIHNACYLNTIKERPEKASSSNSYLEIVSDSDCEEAGLMDPYDPENINTLKKFRNDNYFECHSAKSRIDSRRSVTSLQNHKCIYRFYLNDRLFPVPLNTDCNNTIRCIECHLPLKNKDIDSESSKINGTIQAKVRLNDDVQDMMLMLPVNKYFVVNERRKRQKQKVDDSLYFGIIKLNINGDSIFNRNVPSNSFALKYQKSYKEFNINEDYKYEGVTSSDKIFV